MSNTESIETLNPSALRAFCETAQAGDYLAEFDDCGSTQENDPGSRCGYDDRELGDIKRILRARGLTLATDDRGIIVVEVGQ